MTSRSILWWGNPEPLEDTVTQENLTIAPLTKVRLALRTPPKGRQKSEADAPIDFVFIYGIGTEGLTGFERALIGKQKGDQLTVEVAAPRAASHFEHLYTPILQAVQTRPPFELFLDIQSVDPATDQEVVHALTQKVENSGCSGDCGCGCA